MLDKPFTPIGEYMPMSEEKTLLYSHFTSRYVGLDETSSRPAANAALYKAARSAAGTEDPETALRTALAEITDTGSCLTLVPGQYYVTQMPDMVSGDDRGRILKSAGSPLTIDQVIELTPKNVRGSYSDDPVESFIMMKHMLGLRQMVARTSSTRLSSVGYAPDFAMGFDAPPEFTVARGDFVNNRQAFDRSQDALEAYATDTQQRINAMAASAQEGQGLLG